MPSGAGKQCSNNRVVITGLGVITPIGNNKNDFWAGICEAKNGIGRLTKFDPEGFSSHVSAEIKDFDPSPYLNSKKQRRMDTFVQYAVVSAHMASEDAGLDMAKEDPTQVGVIIGSGIGGLYVIEAQHKIYLEKGPSRISPFLIPMLILDMAAGQVSIELGAKGPNVGISTACASASHAIGDGFRMLREGRAQVMIAGGTESCITEMGFGGFCACRALSTSRNNEPEHACRPFDAQRDGFVMGEGAGVVILETLEHARARGADIYCELVGFGATADAYHMTAPDPQGDGAARAMKTALDDAGMPAEEIDYINAHGTSTPPNDRIETLAIKNVFGDHAKKLAVSSTKSMIGHLLGAAGGVELAASALAIKHGIIPPTRNYEHPDPDCDLDYVPNQARQAELKAVLSNSLGFGGHNATLIIRKI